MCIVFRMYLRKSLLLTSILIVPILLVGADAKKKKKAEAGDKMLFDSKTLK